MKQLLFLLLFPCLCVAQYTGNAGQKITLGEQTTADGLVFRGLAADTTRKPSVDTMAFILLDTNTNIIWQYKKATNNAWTRVGGSISSGVTGTLPVANGGTGSGTQNFVDLTTTQSSIAGAKTFTSAVTATRFNPTANTATGTGMFAPTSTSLGFSTNNINRLTLNSGGNIGIGIVPNTDWNTGYTVLQTNYATYASENARIGQALFVFNAYNTEPADAAAWKRVYGNNAGMYEQSSGNHKWYTASSGAANSAISWVEGMTLSSNAGLSIGTTTTAPANGLLVAGTATFSSLVGSNSRAVNAAADGTLSASSSITIKENVNNLNYGLNKILQLQPKSFNYIDKNKYGEGLDIGFIAEDVYPIVPEATGTMNDGFIYFDAVKLIPILTKAIQEQQALIKALEQRILILENK